jgi:hypothetical protein
MALTKQKTVNLSGESKIGDESVARFSAQVSSNDALSQDIVTTIVNVDLYRKNSKAVRDDANAFREYVYTVQDQVYSENETK